jgi:hypothetical protein
MKQKIIDILTSTVQQKQSILTEFQTIKDLLTPLVGKRITVHLQKQLPEGMILESENEKMYIKITATGNRHPICRAANKTINLQVLQELNATRLEHLERQLITPSNILGDPARVDKFTNFYIEVHKAYTQLKDLFNGIESDADFDSYHNPAHNVCLEEAGIPNEILFRLTKK